MNAPAQLSLPSESTWMEAGLEFLVNLATKGEVDPWDVDLKVVIDRFLGQLGKADPKRELMEAAQIIFFVAVLLRIKSQSMLAHASQNTPEDDLLDDRLDFAEIEFDDLSCDHARACAERDFSPKDLDFILRRTRTTARRVKPRKVTLEDLVGVFRDIDHRGLQPPKLRRKRKANSLAELADDVVMREDELTDVFELAHEEDLEKKIELLSEVVLQRLDIDRTTKLSELEGALDGDRIDTFLSALFLSHSGRTELRQPQFYGDLFIVRLA